MRSARASLRLLLDAWRINRVGKVALGKYIVLYASLLHLVWAGLLIASPEAAGPTPVHVLTVLCGGRYRAAFVLLLIALAALMVIFQRGRVSNRAMSLLLVPQQLTLLLSAGAGMYATIVQHYADGAPRAWPFILADQFPVILAALLYTIAVLEAASFERERE
jgi:hypothetical protein